MMMLSQIAQWTQGELQGEDTSVASVVTDSRAMQANSLFVALKGEHFDAHKFLAQAKQDGAVAALVSQPQTTFRHAVLVNDTREGLGLLAAGYAQQFDVARVGVTGNAGKTTVKEMVAVMLGDNTLATAGNFNNDIGVPLTLLRLDETHRYAVVELGANAPGEIAWTSALVKPQVAMITNVTGAHLEGFGSMQGIANAKAEIFSGCEQGAQAVINADDSFADFFSEQAKAQGLSLIRVSAQGEADLYAQDIQLTRDAVRFVLQPLGEIVTVPLPGRHQVLNALMACAAVQALGVDLAQALPRLNQLKPVPGRMNVRPMGGGVVVDDTYNAHPGSVRAAINWLAEQPAPRVLALGALGELGEQAEHLIAELGEYAKAASLDGLLLMPEVDIAAQHFGDNARVMETREAMAQAGSEVLQQGGTVLVKGSRSASMEAVVQHIAKIHGQDEQQEGTH